VPGSFFLLLSLQLVHLYATGIGGVAVRPRHVFAIDVNFKMSDDANIVLKAKIGRSVCSPIGTTVAQRSRNRVHNRWRAAAVDSRWNREPLF